MIRYGLICFEADYVPQYGVTFLINIPTTTWKFHLFVYECSDPNDPNQWYGYYLYQLKKCKYNDLRVNLNGTFLISIQCVVITVNCVVGLFFIDKGTKRVSDEILKLCHFKDRKLFIIKFDDVNSAGVFGCPLSLDWDPKDINLPKSKSKRIWVKIDESSISALKATIPSNKHQWIGLI
jgi:hypothetical protein